MKIHYRINENPVDAETFDAVAKLLIGHSYTVDKYNGEDVSVLTWIYYNDNLLCMVIISNEGGGEE